MTDFKKDEPGARSRVEFVCTDRGQHSSVRLGHSLVGAVIHSRRSKWNTTQKRWSNDVGSWSRRDPGMFAIKKRPQRSNLPGAREVTFQKYVTTWGDPLKPEGTEFLCPKCPRNPQKQQKWLETFMAGIRAAGIAEVDISLYLD